MQDIVFPNKNEKEFIEMAKKLGIDELIFAYKKKEDFYTKKENIKITNTLYTEPNKIRKGTTTICNASREAIERGASIVYGFETIEPKEHTHYRKSGMNQVLCKLATNKKVKIGFAFSTILNNHGQKRAIILGRMMQNIKFCKKYKTPIIIASFAANPYEMRAEAELKAFFSQLGL
ncbi:hypothetical protein KY319_02795 [Candidatus Woesearchaeota archaeon]|nr:hypothetical protein [Candidatus Woesearchaeota archaeon]